MNFQVIYYLLSDAGNIPINGNYDRLNVTKPRLLEQLELMRESRCKNCNFRICSFHHHAGND